MSLHTSVRHEQTTAGGVSSLHVRVRLTATFLNRGAGRKDVCYSSAIIRRCKRLESVEGGEVDKEGDE